MEMIEAMNSNLCAPQIDSTEDPAQSTESHGYEKAVVSLGPGKDPCGGARYPTPTSNCRGPYESNLGNNVKGIPCSCIKGWKL